MHDNWDTFKTCVGFNVLGQHIAIHLRHFRINQNQANCIAQGSIGLLRMRRQTHACA